MPEIGKKSDVWYRCKLFSLGLNNPWQIVCKYIESNNALLRCYVNCWYSLRRKIVYAAYMYIRNKWKLVPISNWIWYGRDEREREKMKMAFRYWNDFVLHKILNVMILSFVSLFRRVPPFFFHIPVTIPIIFVIKCVDI